jgi:hypothetical protein
MTDSANSALSRSEKLYSLFHLPSAEPGAQRFDRRDSDQTESCLLVFVSRWKDWANKLAVPLLGRESRPESLNWNSSRPIDSRILHKSSLGLLETISLIRRSLSLTSPLFVTYIVR